MTRHPVVLLALFACGACFPAREIGRYDFAAGDPAGVVVDKSGFDNHGKIVADATVPENGILACAGKGYVTLPGGAAIFGPEAVRGSVSIWVKPDFAPEDLPHGQWEGYSMIFYAMLTDGNGLPDGYDEIGIWCHGPNLRAKVSRSSAGPSFSTKSPLRKGEWSHIALCWRPSYKALYVGGDLVEEDGSKYDPPQLDDFPAMLGQHPASKRWAWKGELADCRLFDDALTVEDVQALARVREASKAPAGTYDPEKPWIEKVEWGEVWMGERTVRVMPSPRAGPAGLEAFCEVLDEAGRETFKPGTFARVELALPAYVGLRCAIRQEGRGRVNLIVRRRDSGLVLSARSAFVNVPPLSPTLAAIEGRLRELDAVIGAESVPPEVTNALAPRYKSLANEFAAIKQEKAETKNREQWDALIARADELLGQAAQLQTRATIYARGVKDGKLPDFGIGVEHALRKYLKHDPFKGKLEAPIELNSAKHEYEAAQILIFALDKDLEGVEVEISDLKGPEGASIAAENVTWNQVGYIETKKPTYKVRHVGLWPDPLLPPAPLDVKKGAFESVWLTVYVPPDSKAGDYTGRVKIAPKNAEAREVPLKLHVWDFALPEKLSLVSAFGLNGMGSFQRNADVDRYVQNAHQHRISLGFPGVVFASARPVYPSFDLAGKTLRCRIHADAPEDAELGPLFLVCRTEGRKGARLHGPLTLKAGQWSDISLTLHEDERPTSIRFEYRNAGPVKLTISTLKVGDRTFDAMDKPDWWHAGGPWSTVRKAVGGLEFQIGPATKGRPFIEQWPHTERSAVYTPADIEFHLDFTEFDKRIEKYLERGINAIRIPVPGCPRKTSEEQARERVAKNYLGPIAKAYQDHLKEKGWLEYAYTYVSDEPHASDYPALNVVQGTIKKWAPELRNMMTARSFPPELKYIDIWCPEVYSFNPKLAAEEQAKGKLVWWYPAFSTRHPFPDFWIDYPAIDNRIIFWLTWKHNLDGLLYWSISSWWRANPWETGMTYPGANGDGNLIYPGKDGGPVNSIRWECIRDGSEDYEYFVLLKGLVEKAGRDEGGGGRDRIASLRRAKALLAIDDSVAKSWREWSFDPEGLIAARDEMGETIEQLQEVGR